MHIDTDHTHAYTHTHTDNNRETITIIASVVQSLFEVPFNSGFG